MGRPFCEDLVTEILLHLPTKSVVRFKCLGKYYNQLVSDPKFATKHALQYRSSPDEVLGLFRHSVLDADKVLLCYCSFHSKPKVELKNYTILSPIIASCNGLLLLILSEFAYCVYNPLSSHSFRVLPKLAISYEKWNLGFAYDPICLSSIEFKLVCIYRERLVSLIPGEEVYGFLIFDPSANSWRMSNSKLTCSLSQFLKLENQAQAVYMNGLLHWFRTCGDIVTFDLKKEEARLITMPGELQTAWLNDQKFSWFGAVKGLIYLVFVTKTEVQMWVLLDYENSKWGLVRNRVKGLARVARPIFFDGEWLVLNCGPNQKELRMFNMKLEKWKKIGRLPSSDAEMDGTSSVCFIPFLPTLALLSESGAPRCGGVDGAFRIFQTMMASNNKCKRRKLDRELHIIDDKKRLRPEFAQG